MEPFFADQGAATVFTLLDVLNDIFQGGTSRIPRGPLTLIETQAAAAIGVARFALTPAHDAAFAGFITNKA